MAKKVFLLINYIMKVVLIKSLLPIKKFSVTPNLNKQNNINNNIDIEYKNLTEKFDSTKSIIPLNIFQTWNTLKLPNKMKVNIEKLKKQNPEFTYHLYDDDMCKQFIKENFDKKILDTFDKLKPGAFKADLWRLCILYKYGGIYLDIKYSCHNNFKLIYLTTKEYFVRDRVICNQHGIYNALMISIPENKLLMDMINKIVDNVEKKFYGKSCLEVTGPLCINKFFTQKNIKEFKLRFDGDQILFKNIPILRMYKEYRTEQKNFGNTRYTILWKNKDIYNI